MSTAMPAFKHVGRSVCNVTYNIIKASMLVSRNGHSDILLHIWAASMAGSIAGTPVMSGGISPRVLWSTGKMPTNANIAFY